MVMLFTSHTCTLHCTHTRTHTHTHTHTHRPAVPLPCDRLTLQECLEPHCFRVAQVCLIVGNGVLLPSSLPLSLLCTSVHQATHHHDQDELHQADKEGHIPCAGGWGGAGGCPLVYRDGKVWPGHQVCGRCGPSEQPGILDVWPGHHVMKCGYKCG